MVSAGTFSISLPFPPSVNNLFSTVPAGKKTKRVSTPQAKAYLWRVKQCVCAEGQHKAPAGELRMVIAVWMPNRQKRDLDNLCKAPLDALVKAGVMADDSLITDLRIYRAGYDKENPRITIWLEAA